ncbi:MAG: nitroreductase family deazaflavin-dependent oxidoreductase [Bryobacteraceae bacterium]|nr:nitroreductase family deazaflavin-dependent oxidoreductase [Bryobacteraceae bacterium]
MPDQVTPRTTPGRSLLQLFAGMHRWLYRSTGGVIGGRFRGGPVLLLTTIGRKTGQARTWPLIYFPDGKAFVIVGSNGGRDVHPAWYLNLRSNPTATIEVGRKRFRVKARQAEGAERDRLWQLVIRTLPFYADYQTGTQREIPLMILAPEESERQD